MKQNLINETYSPLVRMMVTILVKTTGLMAFNKIWKCDINNKKKNRWKPTNLAYITITAMKLHLIL